MRARLPILILAAGASSRMGGLDKLLEPVRGKPLLRERVETARATGREVIVALPANAAQGRWAAVRGTGAATIAVADAGAGLSASLRAGLAALPEDSEGALVLLADMPDITTEDLATLLDAFDGKHILRASDAQGRPGHPVIFPARLLPELAALTGDRGAREVLAGRRDVRLVPLPGRHAFTDLDTPEDWARWRAGTGE
jgi:molybdenum cofactor cytidylyltransferase